MRCAPPSDPRYCWQPYTGEPHNGDTYGVRAAFLCAPTFARLTPAVRVQPMILAFFEMLALRTGIVPRPGVGLLWSGLQEGANANYTQRLADHRYTLRLHGDKFEGTIDGKMLFVCTAGVRVVTDLGGEVIQLWGIEATTVQAELSRAGRTPQQITVKPNEIWRVGATTATRARAAPFIEPHS